MTSERDVPEGSVSSVLEGSAPREHGSASLDDLYRLARAHRGGGELFTTRVNDPLGSWVAAVAIRFHIHPTVVTITDLGLAIVASTFVITQADQLQSGWVPGLVALLFWQLVYILDCADGQIARVTGKTSSFGARVDVLVDFLVQITVVSALVTVITQRVEPPVALIVFGAMAWPIGLLLLALRKSDDNENRAITHLRRTIAVIQLIRDNGVRLLIVGLWLFVHPQTIVIPVATICAVNGCVLVASIGREAYLSMHVASVPDWPEKEVMKP